MPMDKKYEDSAIAQYYHAIENKEIVVSKDIKSLYRHLYQKLYDDKIDGYHYDAKKARHPIEFIESFCKLIKVRGNGEVHLMLWQKAMIESIFGFVDDDGLRQYREIMLLIARKNSKTMTAAFIALYLLVCENESEIYSAATTREQSKIVWDAVIRIKNKSEALRKYITNTISEVRCSVTASTFRPLASDSNSLDGLNASCIILDEIHSQKDASLYDVLVDSTANREEPLTLLLTTQGFLREGLLDAKISEYEQIIQGYTNKQYKDDRRIGFLYRIDAKNEWKNKKNWMKANPGIPEIRSLSTLAEDVERAKNDPSKVNNLLTKFFCFPENGTQHFLDYDIIQKNNKTYDISKMDIRYVISGFDLSRVRDWTAASVMWKLKGDETIYVDVMAWIPSDIAEKQEKESKLPISQWVQRGYLRLCEGNKINYKDVVSYFEEIQQKLNAPVWKCGYDPWSASYLTDELKALWGDYAMEEVRQGPKSLSLPLQNLKSDFEKGLINYNNNPVFAYACTCAQVVTDNNNNWNNVKDRNNPRIKDDPFVSFLCAYTAYQRYMDDYNNLI